MKIKNISVVLTHWLPRVVQACVCLMEYLASFYWEPGSFLCRHKQGERSTCESVRSVFLISGSSSRWALRRLPLHTHESLQFILWQGHVWIRTTGLTAAAWRHVSMSHLKGWFVFLQDFKSSFCPKSFLSKQGPRGDNLGKIWLRILEDKNENSLG
jgi:hypothetical protein